MGENPLQQYRDLQTTVIMNKAQDGDREALNELLHRVRPIIEAEVRAKKGKQLSAYCQTEDFVQDVSVELVKFLPRLRVRNSSTLDACLRRIVINNVCEFADRLKAARRDVRKQRPIPEDTILYLDPPQGQDSLTASAKASRDEEIAMIRMLVSLIRPKYQLAFIYFTMLGWKSTDVAKLLGCSDAEVRVWARRGYVELLRLINLKKEGRLIQGIKSMDDDDDGEDVDDERLSHSEISQLLKEAPSPEPSRPVQRKPMEDGPSTEKVAAT